MEPQVASSDEETSGEKIPTSRFGKCGDANVKCVTAGQERHGYHGKEAD
jgi:hypothetical protein